MGDVLRVLVADDDEVVRDAYRAVLGRADGFEQVGEAADGRTAVDLALDLRPDVVLMDLQMPHLSGIEATTEICRRWPEAVVVVITTFGTGEHVVAALRAGASGYLLKDAATDVLVEAMHQARAGEMPLSAAVRRELVTSVRDEAPRGAVAAPAPVHALTPRELELLGWLAHGLTNRQIAERMYLSAGSVKQYLSTVGTKLGARSRTQILVTAVRLRLVDPDAVDQPV